MTTISVYIYVEVNKMELSSQKMLNGRDRTGLDNYQQIPLTGVTLWTPYLIHLITLLLKSSCLVV